MKRHDSPRSGFVSLLFLLAAAALALIVFVAVVVASLVVLAAGSSSTFLKALAGGRTIDVVIYAGGNRIDHPLPALNGASAGSSGGWAWSAQGKGVQFHSDESYKVASDARGHFTVTLHRVVEQDGSKSIMDGTLPVWDSEPAADKRVKLNDGSSVAAYFTKGSK
ncbi:MAG: hypothetical protein WDO13_00440 [Verrucomicrobiota bacterium]